MKRPVIGVTPLVDKERESLWMLPDYFEAVTAAGGLPIMLPLSVEDEELAQLYTLCDGILFTGGQDTDARAYGQEPHKESGTVIPERDEQERILFDLCLRGDKPSLGICRGLQHFNILMGGDLYQHLPDHLPSQVEHEMKAPYDRYVHENEIVEGTPLYDLLQVHTLGVNSYHHQGIDKLAKDFVPMAYAPDGLVEAAYVPGKRMIWGLQWHPEFLHKMDENSQKIWRAFVKACADDAGNR